MESKGITSAVQAKATTKPATTLYSSNSSTFTGNCYKCRKQGHIAADCPKGSTGQVGGGAVAKRGGRAPQHRKFHCAYCKDNSKRCFTNWCENLRKLDFATRKQMLEANQDCEKCAEDCPKGACKQKFEKICGQGIEGGGCGKQHMGNELFCPTAKCFMSATTLHAKVGSLDSHLDKELNPW